MRTVTDFRAWAGRQWDARWPGWLAVSEDSPDAAWWPLHPPTQTEIRADPDAVAAWVASWQRAERDGVQVRWVERTWPAHGRQRLPDRAGGTPDLLAAMAGQAEAWKRATATAELVRQAWPGVDFAGALSAAARPLAALTEAEAVHLVGVLAWLATHPASEAWERELPVVGIDSKWIERHRRLVAALMGAIDGRAGVGLRRQAVRFRVRMLDPALARATPEDFAADLATLARLDVAPARVIVCENATCVAALPQLEGTLAVHGMGFAAPLLVEIPWLRDAEVQYWGDLDSYGFAILGRMREALPGVRSALMDAATWAAHEAMAVPEPRPFRGEIGNLTLLERDALALVRAGDRRLEQERLARGAVAAALGG